MSVSITTKITKSRVQNGYLAVPKGFAKNWFPDEKIEINVLLEGRNGFSILPFVPASHNTKEARVYGLKSWYNDEQIQSGDNNKYYRFRRNQ